MAAAPPEAFTVTVTESADRTIVAASGELDLATAPRLEEALRGPAAGGGHLVIDLQRLAFIDSSGVRALITTDAVVKEAGGRLSLVIGAAEGPVAQVLRISGLLTVFEVLEDPGA